jgi:hypothetical protein
MRAPLIFSAALILGLLAVVPAASALTLQTSKNPEDSSDSSSNSGGANLTDPESGLPAHIGSPNYLSQQTEDSGSSFHIGGATVHFGMSGGAGGQPGGNQWFLDSPASRNVPSQMH